MTIRDGEMEYGTPYIASIDSNALNSDGILKTLMRECAMPELDIDPDEPDEFEIHYDGKIEAHNGDYRWIWLDSVVVMPKAHFEIMKKYNIYAFKNLKPISNSFQFR
jgi:hypothetical protein